MFGGLFKTARQAFDQVMKDANQGDRGGRKWDAQISGCTAVLARDLDPGTRSDILRKRGDAYFQKTQYGMHQDDAPALLSFALADYNEAIRINPDNALAYCSLAVAHWHDLSKDEDSRVKIGTENYSEAIRRDPRLAKAYYGRAILWSDTDIDKYFKDIDKAIELDPHNANYTSSRSHVNQKLGRTSSAIDDLSKAMATSGGIGKRYRAFLYEKQGLLDKALADLNVALKEDEGGCFEKEYLSRASVYIKLGKIKLALNDCKKVMDRCGESEWYYAAHAFNTRGVANAILGNIKNAVDDYNEAIRLNPDLRVALLNRGDLYEKQGKLKDALADFEKAGHARDPIEDEQDLIIARSPDGSEASEAYERVKRALGG